MKPRSLGKKQQSQAALQTVERVLDGIAIVATPSNREGVHVSQQKSPEPVAKQFGFGKIGQFSPGGSPQEKGVEVALVVGGKGKGPAVLLTLTERKTRKQIIRKLKDKTQAAVVRAINGIERQMGEEDPQRFASCTHCGRPEPGGEPAATVLQPVRSASGVSTLMLSVLATPLTSIVLVPISSILVRSGLPSST